MTTKAPPKLSKPVIVGLIISALLLITAVVLEVHNWTNREGIRTVPSSGPKDPMLQPVASQAKVPVDNPGDPVADPSLPAPAVPGVPGATPRLVPPLDTPPANAPQTPESLAREGLRVVEQFKCMTCHSIDGRPLLSTSLKDLYGKQSKLVDGTTVTVDDAYIRESILEPQAKIVVGPKVAMLSYKGQMTEQQILAVIAYIKSISPEKKEPENQK